ncbi:hypothetical protein B0J13DRAFT_657533 [Dactylonectria estremocensis]|uniref:Uncharacterized protein n=1 Tax=Dactylonectria estremocensis TaxID=1079267 RepID=A0A9P9D5R7_9HYPO|nr:hypothetical protein B0J13DRAFT_659118 [Dactylonectria estremocensis]KAH7113002.1 hypothetical protein B0J13DRAFT_657533 [Dactylonectria estremocensis]
MAIISDKSRQAAARAACAYLAGDAVTRTTRGNPALPRKLTVIETASHHHTNASLVKKYISLLRAGKVLPSGNKGGQPPALTAAEERTLVTFIRTVEKSVFAVTEPAIRNYASFI